MRNPADIASILVAIIRSPVIEREFDIGRGLAGIGFEGRGKLALDVIPCTFDFLCCKALAARLFQEVEGNADHLANRNLLGIRVGV